MNGQERLPRRGEEGELTGASTLGETETPWFGGERMGPGEAGRRGNVL